MSSVLQDSPFHFKLHQYYVCYGALVVGLLETDRFNLLTRDPTQSSKISMVRIRSLLKKNKPTNERLIITANAYQ